MQEIPVRPSLPCVWIGYLKSNIRPGGFPISLGLVLCGRP